MSSPESPFRRTKAEREADPEGQHLDPLTYLTATFPGTCVWCGDPIKPGHLIYLPNRPNTEHNPMRSYAHQGC